jgi:hypothetical protein
VPLADFLVRAVMVADDLTASEEQAGWSKQARARTLSRDLQHALNSAHDLFGLDPDPPLARDLDRASIFALDLDQTLARDLDLDRVLDIDRVLDLACVVDRTAALALDITLFRTRDRVYLRALDLALAIGRALDQALDRGRLLDRAMTRVIDRTLNPDPFPDREGERLRIRDRSIASSLPLASELSSVLGGVLSDSLGIEHLDGLADALLTGALDDFSQADLSGVDLSHVGLVGLRWSIPGTRWPPSLDVDALLDRSEETEPGSGVYIILPPRETERAGEKVRV